MILARDQPAIAVSSATFRISAPLLDMVDFEVENVDLFSGLLSSCGPTKSTQHTPFVTGAKEIESRANDRIERKEKIRNLDRLGQSG